jgi:hypothetical protein
MTIESCFLTAIQPIIRHILFVNPVCPIPATKTRGIDAMKIPRQKSIAKNGRSVRGSPTTTMMRNLIFDSRLFSIWFKEDESGGFCRVF